MTLQDRSWNTNKKQRKRKSTSTDRLWSIQKLYVKKIHEPEEYTHKQEREILHAIHDEWYTHQRWRSNWHQNKWNYAMNAKTSEKDQV